MNEAQPLLGYQIVYKKSYTRRIIKATILTIIIVVLGFFAYKSMTAPREYLPTQEDENIPLEVLFVSAPFEANSFKTLSLECKGRSNCNSTVQYANIPRATYKYTILSNQDSIDYVSVSDSIVDNVWHLKFTTTPLPNQKFLRIDLEITLPKSTFDYHGQFEVGSLKWFGGGSTPHFQHLANVGSVRVENVHASRLFVDAKTGSVDVRDLVVSKDTKIVADVGSVLVQDAQLDSLVIEANTGSITLKKVVCSTVIDLNAKIGSVSLDASANQVKVKTSTGSVDGSVQNYDTLDVDSSVGTINLNLLPNKDSINHLSSDTGSTKVAISDFKGNFELETKMGSIHVTGDYELVRDDKGMMSHKKYGISGHGMGFLRATSNLGSINLTLK